MKIFITGVSSGIGWETAKLLVQSGHEVWGVGRRAFSISGATYTQCDVTDLTQIEKVFQAMRSQNFIPDIVVLGSAVYPKDLTGEDFDLKKTRHGFAVNFFGALVWIEKFLPLFRQRNSGKFVAVSSIAAFRPDRRSVCLPSSKAALSMAMRSLRLRYERENIKFTVVYFGPVATPVVPEFMDEHGQKKYFFVLSAPEAARKLSKAIFGEKDKYFFPSWLVLLVRLSLIFPDSVYSTLSQRIKK